MSCMMSLPIVGPLFDNNWGGGGLRQGCSQSKVSGVADTCKYHRAGTWRGPFCLRKRDKCGTHGRGLNQMAFGYVRKYSVKNLGSHMATKGDSGSNPVRDRIFILYLL